MAVAHTGYVSLDHSDRGILRFMQALCLEKLSLKEAIDMSMKEIGVDPCYSSVFEYYLQEKDT